MKRIITILSVFVASLLLASCTQTTQKVDVEKTPTITRADVPAPTYGSGDHKIEIFADFQCPACQQGEVAITPILEEFADQGKLTIVYRQYPLTRIHPNAFEDARSAMCAHDQEKYQEYKKALYNLEISKAGAKISLDDYKAIFNAIPWSDITTFESCMKSDKHKDYVQKSLQLGDSLGIQGTPTYMIDEKPVNMAAFESLESFKTFLTAVVEQPINSTQPTLQVSTGEGTIETGSWSTN